MAAILRAFKKYAEKAEFSGARHLARTCRKNDPTCTTEEIVAALHYKGHDLEGADDNFAVLFRKVPEYFTDEYRQFWLDFKANPPERVYTKTELREMKLQAEARVGLYVPRDERHPPQTGVNDFLRGNADKLDCASLPGAAQKIAAESAAELRAVAASSEAGNALQHEELEGRLTVMEKALVDALLTAETDSTLLAIRTAAEDDVAPYRSKMSTDQIASLKKQYEHKRLFELHQLPRLSLFFMRQ